MTKITRYATPAAFRMALEERLRQAASSKGSAWLTQQRRLMVFDRLLARLLVAAPDRWILKGAVALDYRLGDRARATMDLDLAHEANAEEATFDLLGAQTVNLEDYFSFEIERVQNLGEAAEGTLRFRVRANLDRRRFETITLDVGFTNLADLSPDRLHGPPLFDFAGLSPVKVPALPLENHVAEKLHAYTRDYGDRKSSRVKDLVDLVLISGAASFEAGRLRHAIDSTFVPRGRQNVPDLFPLPPDHWESPYSRLATDVGLDADVESGHVMVAKFLDPILATTISPNAQWSPATRAWKEPDDSSSSG
jgi:hypothetical protein